MRKNPKKTLPRSVHLQEAHRLAAALDLVDDTAGHVVEVAGEPGSGKTRLVSDLVGEATRRGFEVFLARCREREQSIPLHPFGHLFQGRSESALRFRPDALSLPCVLELLERTTRNRTLLVVDDFHHADEQTVELVERLIKLAIPNLLVVVVHRPRQACPRMADALAHAREIGTAERIAVRPLTLTQAAAVSGLPADDPRLPVLHERSGGNPAYLVVLARAEHTPDQTAALMDELAPLAADERAVVDAAAVLGEDADVTSLTAVAELCPDVVRVIVTRLVERDLFRPVGVTGCYRFRHRVVRDVVHDRTEPAWRAAAHQRALAVLLARQAPFDRLLGHVEVLLEQPDPRCHRLVAEAATWAVDGEPAVVAEWLGHVLAAWPDDEVHRAGRLGVALKRAAALAACGRVAESSALYRDTLAAMPPSPPEARTAAVIQCVQLKCLLGHVDEATHLVDAELALLPEDRHVQRIELRLARQFVTMARGWPGSGSSAEHTLGLATRHGDRLNQVGALASAAFQRLFSGDVAGAGEAVSVCASIVDMLSDADLGQHSEYLGMLAWTEVNMDRFAAARRHFARGADLVRRLGMLHQVPTMLLGLTVTALQVAQFDKAMASAAEVGRLAGEMGADQLRSLALAREATCALAVERDCARALVLAEEALASLPPDSVYGQPEAVLALAGAVLADGAPLRCTALILSLGGATLDGVPLVDRAMCFDRLTEAAAAMGDVPGARRWAASAAKAAEATGLRSHRGYALSAEGHLRRVEGDAGNAMSCYAAAADRFGEVRMAAAQIRMFVAAAGCASGAGDSADDAALFLALARELAGRCGAWGDYERARVAQAETWTPRVTATEQPLTSVLTSREVEIARLAAKGERTKDIARDLFLSPRTVETHLSRIYQKMHVKSRAALASTLRLDFLDTGVADVR